jgi:hypothetical protein
MEIQTRHRLKLLNSKCEYVCIVENLSKKLDYGDDIECCLNKLYLASKLINRLECYNFPLITTSENVNSEFFAGISESEFFALSSKKDLNIQLNVNGTVYDLASDAVNTGFDLIINKLTALGLLVSYTITGDKNKIFNLVLTCDVIDISFIAQFNEELPFEITFSNTVVGACPIQTITTPDNCIEQSNLREMYAVLGNLLS